MHSTSSYADLEIRILNGEGARYAIELTVDGAQHYRGRSGRGDLLQDVAVTAPEKMGESLFDWLFDDESLRTAWAQIRGQSTRRRLRLRVDTTTPELHTIPWELLFDRDTEGGMSLASSSTTPFSRYLAGAWQPGGPILRRPIKILVAISDPKNLETFDLAPVERAEEISGLREAVSGIDGVELITLDGPCTLVNLEEALRSGIHILHLVAHGKYSERRGQTALFFADEDNKVDLVDGSQLAEMLARQLEDAETQHEEKLRLVFLASCQTATNNPADAFRAVGPALVSAGVPAVLAMQDLVPIKTSQAFSQTFYQRLLQHGSVDLACNEARSTILTADLTGAAIPVLYMRLRNGQLLGQRGRIAGLKSENFWPFLLDYLLRGDCIPFIGPRATDGLLPSPEVTAEQLAERYGYPLSDRQNLAKVAQYISIYDPPGLRDLYLRFMSRRLFQFLGIRPTQEDRNRYANLSQTTNGLNWAERVLEIQEAEIHHLLADFRLPIYMTTNFDSFMMEALRQKDLQVRRLGPRWERQSAGTPQFTLKPEPSPESPVVFHLNGYDDDPEQQAHMVLSEDDYMAHFVRMARDHDRILPMELIKALGQSSFLIIGYDFDDWQLRLVLQGLVNSISRQSKLNVGVQLDLNPDQDADKVIEYFRRYMNRFDIEIYWGTPQQFVSELHAEWRLFGGSAGIPSDDSYETEEDEYWDDDDW